MDRIEICGTETEVYEKIHKLGFNSNDEIERILVFLKSNSDLLAVDEKIEKRTVVPETPHGAFGFIIMRNNLYVNLKTSTLLIAALLLDIHFTGGMAQLFLTMVGIDGRAIVKFSEYNGEKCILKELLRTSTKSASSDLLIKFGGECCNNNLSCKYKSENKCTCTPQKVADILDGLAKHNILKKEGVIYKYCL